MASSLVHVAAVVGLVAVAGAVGYVVGRARAPVPVAAADAGPELSPQRDVDRGRAVADDPTARTRVRDELRAREAVALAPTAVGPGATERAAAVVSASPPWGGETEADAVDPARASAAVLAAEAEAEACAELLGRPIAPPPGLAPRFSGPALSRSVTAAMGQAGVIGDVEGVDCSEFPCIVFARLAGDEEDLEEIERAAALDAYEDDVLTLLLWATTVDPDARTQASARETGLFALAYYGAEDRAAFGDELDRRIRARVLEVWNAERPGPAAAP